jgi:A/G-specific adenine glycosylase
MSGFIPDCVSDLAIVSAESLLAWYDRSRRRLPWRAEPGVTPDPYRVWLSEIMLQQTTVQATIPYYERFVARFPSLEALAAAPLDAVLSAWAGLGYYARARNLHACARKVAAEGGFPHDASALQALPGIGAYTAAAIRAIAFNLPAVPVDGNVERVLARHSALTVAPPQVKPLIRELAVTVGRDAAAIARPGDFAQALFDLGATVCTPTAPDCGRCPLAASCAGRRKGIAASLPVRAPKQPRPVRHGVAFWLEDEAGNVLLHRRPADGLLGGMTGLPGTDWRPAPWTEEEALALAPAQAGWRQAGSVRHGFTHFELRLDLLAARTERLGNADPQKDALFPYPLGRLNDAPLPSVMRKCVRCITAARVNVSGGGSRGQRRRRGIPPG